MFVIASQMINQTKAEAEEIKEKLNQESGRSKDVESDRDILKAQIVELRKVIIVLIQRIFNKKSFFKRKNKSTERKKILLFVLGTFLDKILCLLKMFKDVECK